TRGRGAVVPTPVVALRRLLPHRTELLAHFSYDEPRRWHLRLPPQHAGTEHVEVCLLSWLRGRRFRRLAPGRPGVAADALADGRRPHPGRLTPARGTVAQVTPRPPNPTSEETVPRPKAT